MMRRAGKLIGELEMFLIQIQRNVMIAEDRTQQINCWVSS